MTESNMSSYRLDNYDEFYEENNYTEYFNVTDFYVDTKTVACHVFHIAHGINIAVCVFQVAVFLLAIPGNLLVGLVIISYRHILSPSDIYLFNLMLADMLLALILPFYASSMVQGWLFGNIMCKAVSLVKEASFYISILFLVCISIDRYMAIVWAMEAQKSQRRLCSLVVCGIVWCLGALLSLPALYNEAFFHHDSKVQQCAERFHIETADEWRLATRAMRHLLGFFLPLGIMLVCYSVTVARLLRTSFQRQKAMKVIVAVVVAFLLCWMPYHVVTIMDTILRAKKEQYSCRLLNVVDVGMYATQNLALLHCCINPVLYAFVGEKFRRRFLDVLYRRGVLERGSVSRSTRSTSQSSENNFL